MSAAGGAAIVAQATRASGLIVRVEPADFIKILLKNYEPLVVHAEPAPKPTNWFSRSNAAIVKALGMKLHLHQYLTSYRGLAFVTAADAPIELPNHCQVVEAQQILISG